MLKQTRRRSRRSENRSRRKPHSPRRRLALESLEQRTLLAVFTVTSDADTVDPDDGALTLREAILEANSPEYPGAHTIEFDISGGGAQTITLGTSTLPGITNPVTIDGSTQGGLITIDAAACR